MKQLILCFCLMFINCKSETNPELNTENEIDQSVYLLWNNFTDTHPKYKEEALPESWYFHNNKEDANRLAKLTLSGKKTATTSGLYMWYKEANAELPKVGTKHIITDFDGKAQALIEITQVDTIPFNQISEQEAAMDMGTSDDALNKWRQAHWNFFKGIMKERGEQPTEEMRIVFERFEILRTVYD